MVIAFCGRRRSGKSLATNLIVDAYPQYFMSYAFADPIKAACREIFGWDEERLYGDQKEEIDEVFGVSSRYAQQTLGTEWGRMTIYDEIWVLAAEQRILQNYNNGFHTVIGDLRFDNEAEKIRSLGGVVVEVYNPAVEDNQYSGHDSENGLTIEPDYTIFNDFVSSEGEYTQESLEEYSYRVLNFLKMIMEDKGENYDISSERRSLAGNF